MLVDVGLKPGTGFEPTDPGAFSGALAAAINRLAGDPELRARFAAAGRARVEAHFSWDSIAKSTMALYERLLAAHAGR